MSVEAAEQNTGGGRYAGVIFFYGEIIEQFRQIERATERRMVALCRRAISIARSKQE